MLANTCSFEAEIKKALNNQETLLKFEEHCSADPQLLSSIGRASGQQVRVRPEGGEDYLFTVSEVRSEQPQAILRLGEKARERIAAFEGQKALVASQVTHPDYNDKQAKEKGEFVERLSDRPSENGLVTVAPHGGDIEKWTDKEAETVARLLKVTCWRCRGYKAPGGAGASTRWHITSTDIHEASFPLLNTIISRGFANAVSFHGFSPQDEEEMPADIIIGGGAPEALKLSIQRALALALPSDVVVEIATPGSHLTGDDEQNIVNRLAMNSNGIQIEQNRRVRQKHWRAIAEAVARVYGPG